jgi:thiamine pyrophosphate-dependent acetolactate synthase large subunit-like protein
MTTMHGYEIIKELASLLSGDELIISSNGNISRQVYHYLPRPQIYLRGSMGLAIPVGLGVAIAHPTKKVLTIVGDGNLLMGLGSLATTSFIHPNNLKILILDNNAYATTGLQETTSRVLSYSSLLDGFGIPNLETILRDDELDVVKEKILKLLNTQELCVLPALIDTESPNLSNIPYHPEQITAFQKTHNH